MMKKLRIAQIAPIWNDIPPKLYGGTERVVYSITEELVKRGHEVTLFATSSSKTKAKLISSVSSPMAGKIPWSNPSYTLFNLAEAYKRAGDFDVVHNHADYWCFPFASISSVPTVHTLHNLLPTDKNSHEYQFYNRFKDQKLISISNNQRQGLPWNFIDTVYNGIDANKFSFLPLRGNYLFWVGRITNSKGAKDAILVAKKLQMPLVFLGHLIDDNKEFYEKEIKPLFPDKLITVLKDITQKEKIKYYQNAFCTLMPLHWEEPFGLVMTESLACGTPVIAYKRGSVSEIIKEGKTGFIVEEKDGIDGLANAVKKIDRIDRLSCRKSVKNKFTIEKMVDRYEKIYEKVITNL